MCTHRAETYVVVVSMMPLLAEANHEWGEQQIILILGTISEAECEGCHAIAYEYHGLGWHGPQ